jgi:nucleotide-binding universal stress UspA family protein
MTHLVENEKRKEKPMKKNKPMTIIARIDTQAASYEALDEALRLTSRMPETNLHIAAIPQRGTGPLGTPPPEERAKKAKAVVMQAVTERMREGKIKDDLKLALDVLEGEPSVALSALCASVDADMVVVAAESGGAVRDFLFGSLQNKLVRNGLCPVLVVPMVGPEVIPNIEPPRAETKSSVTMKPPTRDISIPRNVAADENMPLTLEVDR